MRIFAFASAVVLVSCLPTLDMGMQTFTFASAIAVVLAPVALQHLVLASDSLFCRALLQKRPIIFFCKRDLSFSFASVIDLATCTHLFLLICLFLRVR